MFRIFLFVFLCFAISCKGSNKKSKELSSGTFDSPDAIVTVRREAPSPQQKGTQEEKERARERSPREKISSLRIEERGIALGKKDKSFLFSKVDLEKPDPICRRLSGCLKLCSRWEENRHCHQWRFSQVIEQWSKVIDFNEDDEETKIEELEWIAQESDVALFLRESDPESQILKKLLAGTKDYECPFVKSEDVRHEIVEENGKELISLYLDHPEGMEKGYKKIADSSIYNLDWPVLQGFMKQCLNERQSSFIERTIVSNNIHGFKIAHQILNQSCGENADCVRLAYCKIDSEVINSKIKDAIESHGVYLKTKLHSDPPPEKTKTPESSSDKEEPSEEKADEIQIPCGYSDFHSLPL